MISRPDSLARHRRGGFTLVELLVVIGIVVLLVALLLPALTRSVQSARRTRVKVELSGIATALDAYKSDFGDYPRLGTAADPINAVPTPGGSLLARALMGPAPANAVAAAPQFQDGYGDPDAPTFGFKDQRQVINRGGATAVSFPGPVRGPYLDPAKFKMKASTDAAVIGAKLTYGPDTTLLDSRFNAAILYYAARFQEPDVGIGTNFVGPFAASLFNSNDNVLALPLAVPNGSPPEERGLGQLLGDANKDGHIGPGEAAATKGPFLLIAQGNEDGYLVSPVTNFTPAP